MATASKSVGVVLLTETQIQQPFQVKTSARTKEQQSTSPTFKPARERLCPVLLLARKILCYLCRKGVFETGRAKSGCELMGGGQHQMTQATCRGKRVSDGSNHQLLYCSEAQNLARSFIHTPPRCCCAVGLVMDLLACGLQ